jgi:trehalose 6-phosphate phosphatase
MTSIPPTLTAGFDQLAFLLDVDGTLLDLAPTPREVQVPRELRETLERLWQRTGGAVAFVSGRPIGELDLIFSPLQLPAVGGHGAELRPVSDGEISKHAALAPLESRIKRAFATIAELGPGIILEDKGYSLAIHYRLAPDKESTVLQAATVLLTDMSDCAIELLPGKFMIEVKQVGFDKATGVRELMKFAPFTGRRPVLLGDDVTDESMFTVAPEYHGIAIAVGALPMGVSYRFDKPMNVRRWLMELSCLDDPVRIRESIWRSPSDPRPIAPEVRSGA